VPLFTPQSSRDFLEIQLSLCVRCGTAKRTAVAKRKRSGSFEVGLLINNAVSTSVLDYRRIQLWLNVYDEGKRVEGTRETVRFLI
jgi:hypothetical protein